MLIFFPRVAAWASSVSVCPWSGGRQAEQWTEVDRVGPVEARRKSVMETSKKEDDGRKKITVVSTGPGL
jgi:hypothetical protein